MTDPGSNPAHGLLARLAAPQVLLTLVSLFWASNSVVARAVAHDIAPFAISFWRWVLALALILPFTLKYVRRDWPVMRANAGTIGWIGFLSVSVYTATVYLASQTTQAINISVIGSMTPAASVCAAWLLLRERVSLRQGVGFVLAFLGVLVVVARGDPGALLALRITTGDLILLVGVIAWGLYSVLLKSRRLPIHQLSLLTGMFATGLLWLAPPFAVELALGAPLRLSMPGFLAAAYGAVFMSILAYFFFVAGVAALGPNKANAYGYLAPLFAAGLAVSLLGEPFEAFHLVAMVLIFAGVYFATAGRARAALAGRPAGSG